MCAKLFFNILFDELFGSYIDGKIIERFDNVEISDKNIIIHKVAKRKQLLKKLQLIRLLRNKILKKLIILKKIIL